MSNCTFTDAAYMTPINEEGEDLQSGICEDCPKLEITNPIEGTENIIMLMQRQGEGQFHLCYIMEEYPWGDDFESESDSRKKWDDIRVYGFEEYMQGNPVFATDLPSQRRYIDYTCFGANREMHLRYKRMIPINKDFRGEIEIHGDYINQTEFDWTWNYGHNSTIEWYLTDGTNKLGLRYHSENRQDEGLGFEWHMGYIENDTFTITSNPFYFKHQTPPYTESTFKHIGLKFGLERIDQAINLYHWSNIWYFHDGSGDWVNNYSVDDYFDSLTGEPIVAGRFGDTEFGPLTQSGAVFSNDLDVINESINE